MMRTDLIDARPLMWLGIVVLLAGGWACSEDPEGTNATEECTTSADCADDQECVDGTCRDAGDDPDAGLDAGDDAGDDPDAGTDAGDDPDADAGDDAGDDEDTGPDPDCPNPVTCEDEGVECGTISDGCGDTQHCGACEEGEVCGTGDEAGQCVELECTPDTSCEEADVECGTIADGCGNILDCGNCGEDQICGFGDNAGLCIDEDCQPDSCDDLGGVECGLHPDGCGGVVDCGSCGEGESCDGDNQCEDVECDPLSCDDVSPGECGPHPDGCGGTVECGSCSGDDICDSGECVEPDCDPLTCDDYDDINCGRMSDGCGGLTDNCGTCDDPEICGGGGQPNVCGAEAGGGDECVNLCEDQAVCDDGDATTLTGTVYAPDGELPIPNAHVYVPNDPIDDLPEIEDGPVCEQCEDQDLGSPLVGTNTDDDGEFELRHVPADTEFPLVIKIGQWRRHVTIDPVPACDEEELSDPDDTRLPTSQGETSDHDNIPKTAVATGWIDAMECVLHKLGVDTAEFSRNTEDGRIHLYRANGGVVDSGLADKCNDVGCYDDPNTSGTCTDRNPGTCGYDADGMTLQDNLAHNLYGDEDTLHSYDMVVMDCEGESYSGTSSRTTDHLNRMKDYVDAGGRLFASHWAYDWLYETDELQDPVDWTGSGGASSSDAYIDTSFAGGSTFWDWMVLVDDDLNSWDDPEIEIQDPRGLAEDWDDDMATRWIYTDTSSDHYDDAVQQLSFNTPVYADEDEQCGQVAYSAFHVANVDNRFAPAFPGYCGVGDLTTQEKTLAYRLFDLAACVTEDDEPPEPECEPLSCDDYDDVECGQVSDGCGETIDCGECPDGSACGADGEPNQCSAECQPLTCADHGADCGSVDDGCGGTLDCGDCPGDESCGAGGEPNQCGCEPISCDDHGAECGEIDDGCGGTVDCGECPDGEECGADGEPNQCSSDCEPLSCDDHDAECGSVDDGCGGTLECGDCPDPDTCGAGGEPNVCDCVPLTCEDHDAECGEADDGCGGTLECGDCPEDEICSFNECVEESCRDLGESCTDDDQCCSGACAIGGDGEGECISP